MSAPRQLARVRMADGSVYEVSDQTEGINLGDSIVETVNHLIETGCVLIARRAARFAYRTVIIRSDRVIAIEEAQE